MGTAVNTGVVLYSSSANNGGTAELTIDEKGKYHLTINKTFSLKKLVEKGGGIDGAKDSYKLTVSNAY